MKTENFKRNEKLKQAKKRDKKVVITDIAIRKVPYIKYVGLDNTQNTLMQQIARKVLILAKEMNHSNEVAITCDIDSNEPMKNMGVSFGAEYQVDISADTKSYHLLNSEEYQTVVVVHNHPSTKTFSVIDLNFLLFCDNIKILAVVTNQGNVHYILKEQNYDRMEAMIVLKKCIVKHECDKRNAMYHAAIDFLAVCNEVGLYYE